MELDFGSTMIGAITAAVCVLPIVMTNRSRKKRERKILQSLLELASQNNSQIDQHELVGHIGIGMDETKNHMFFYKEIESKEIKQFIDLNEVNSCKIINTSRSFKNENGNQRVIDRLELSFIPIAKNTPEIKLEFFNADVSVQLYGELQSIEKWSKLINDRLKNKR